jgi:hypothetical protein
VVEKKIDSISTNLYYGGTKVYRYKCSGSYIYYFEIPLSSCIYCEIYVQDGHKLSVTNDMLQDCLNDKKNEVLVWEWKR